VGRFLRQCIWTDEIVSHCLLWQLGIERVQACTC